MHHNSIRVLGEEEEWDALDVYFRKDYGLLYSDNIRKWQCAVWNDLIIFPFLKAPVLHLVADGTECFDFVTPYGYTGPCPKQG
jgi:hypothetical protein